MMKRIDITGMVKGKVRVILELPPTRNGKLQILCKCVCQNYFVTTKNEFNANKVSSCGCGGSFTFGKSTTTEYKSWNGMKNRCLPSYSDAKSYFGRGIYVCEKWRTSFDAFLTDMGNKPTPKHTIERIDNNGIYEPSNCRWATLKEQQNNRRSNVFFTYNGRSKTLSQWADEYKIGYSCLQQRINVMKLSIGDALIFKPKYKKK